jgi:hypothetical protein
MLNSLRKTSTTWFDRERSDASHPDAAGGWTDGPRSMLIVPDRAGSQRTIRRRLDRCAGPPAAGIEPAVRGDGQAGHEMRAEVIAQGDDDGDDAVVGSGWVDCACGLFFDFADRAQPEHLSSRAAHCYGQKGRGRSPSVLPANARFPPDLLRQELGPSLSGRAGLAVDPARSDRSVHRMRGTAQLPGGRDGQGVGP